MLAQEDQQGLISKCIWNPLSPLLEPLQNHNGYKPIFSSAVASVTKTGTNDTFSREMLALKVQRLSMLRPDWLNCISFKSPSECRLSFSPAGNWEAGSSFSKEGKRQMVFCLWHKWLISTSFSVTLGLGGTGSLQFLPTFLKIASLWFCSADSLSAAWVGWGGEHWAWD